MNQLEGFIRVFFSSHNLSNGTQSKFLEAEGISGHISIEGSTVHQTHNQTIGHSVLKQVGYVKVGQVFVRTKSRQTTPSPVSSSTTLVTNDPFLFSFSHDSSLFILT